VSTYSSKALNGLPGDPLLRGDDRITPYDGDVVMQATPDAVIRARDVQEISEVLAYCHQEKIPVTFSGGRTGLTGASAASEGVLIATEQVSKVLDVGCTQDGQAYAVAEPGIYLGDLKKKVVEEGYFYPPDPTSFKEACLGGTVATNATGEDTLLYGPTRKYVRGLTIIKADGTVQDLTRPMGDAPPDTKGTAGYIRWDPTIDLMIGSEGTIAYIAEVRVDLLPVSPQWWAAIGFFPDMATALGFVQDAINSQRVKPRALELIDRASLDILKNDPEVPTIPEEAEAAIYWKQEYSYEDDMEDNLNSWLEIMEDQFTDDTAPTYSEQVWMAQTERDQVRFRQWRHLIPSHVNERVAAYRTDGGGKVASDWWVPLEHIQAAIEQTLVDAKEAGLETILFGHIGNGHPHVNYMAHNSEEKEKALELIRIGCQRAVKWGGGVAGEHGIGKEYRDHLRIQYGQKAIDTMMKLKREWDPHWILGRGTLFDVPKEFK